MARPRIYLDHAATTPVLPAAREAMAEALERWHNPSSPHAEGRAARAALEDARDRIKTALGWSGELIFTSGATEAIAIGLRGRGTYETRALDTEHDAVLRVEEGFYRLAVQPDGRINPASLRSNFHPNDATDFFVIQSANSETGVLQPLKEVARQLREHEAYVGRQTLLFSDCSQSAGKLPLPEADLIAVSAHKLGGPPGVGALLVRDLSLLSPSGGQEKGYRGGTENLPAIMGMAAAVESDSEWMAHAADLRAKLEAALVAAGGEVVGSASPRIATIGAYRMPGVPSDAQLIQFDMAGIAISAGSACSSGSLKPSRVLAAMGWSEAAAREVVRVSFGRGTNAEEVDRFADRWTQMAARRRAA